MIQLVSQNTELRFEHYNTIDGLSDNHTTAILQDSRGFIWIGSTHGLNRFDGRTFKNYTILGEQGLTDLNIYALAEDSQGNIWVGTQNGLNKLDPNTEKIKQYFMGSGPGTIPYKWCNSLYVDKENKLWLSTEKGLACYDEPSDSFQNYPVEVFGPDPKINKFISEIFEDSRGRFWLTTSYGVKLFNKTTKKSSSFKISPTRNELTLPFTSIFEDVDGDIWAGCWNHGMMKFNALTNSFDKVPLKLNTDKSLVISDITNFHMNKTMYLLMATNQGLLVFNPKTETAIDFLEPDDYLNCFAFDLQGNLWITGTKGLYKINQNSLAFKWLHLPDDHSKSTIYHIIPDAIHPDNKLFLSTLDGWWQYDRARDTLIAQKLPDDPHELLTTINHWVTDSTGYWFTSMKGFGHFNPRRNKLTDYSEMLTGAARYHFTQFVFEDHLHRLWISIHRIGIMLFEPETNKSQMFMADQNQSEIFLGNDVKGMALTADSTLLIAANNKLYTLSTTDFTIAGYQLPDLQNKIDVEKISPDDICITPDNKVLVSSKLQIFEFRNRRFSKLFPQNGFADFNIEKLYSNPRGNIWVSTSRGIFKTDTTFSKWVNINNRLSWSDNEYISDISFCNDGTVIFAATGKIGVLNDTMLKGSPPPPQIIISKVKYGDNEVFMLDTTDKPLQLSYKDPLEIELSPVNYCYEKEIKIYYQLTGWEDKVYEYSGATPIIYHQLPTGKYEFKTWQQNAEGEKSKATHFHFVIHPPFYLSWWFIALNIILIFSAYTLIIRYKQKKSRELEQLRARIASDLHDDIGATLSAIALYANTLKNQMDKDQPHLQNILGRIGDNSREMVSSMSDIVWAINPANDFGEKFILRMRDYAADMCQSKDILLHFHADETLSGLKLPLELRKNMYLIFKESINNAVKYSGAQNIHISLRSSEKAFYLSVYDDGTGFDTNSNKQGNGLKNMQSRAVEMGAVLSIDSIIGKGTKVNLQW